MLGSGCKRLALFLCKTKGYNCPPTDVQCNLKMCESCDKLRQVFLGKESPSEPSLLGATWSVINGSSGSPGGSGQCHLTEEANQTLPPVMYQGGLEEQVEEQLEEEGVDMEEELEEQGVTMAEKQKETIKKEQEEEEFEVKGAVTTSVIELKEGVKETFNPKKLVHQFSDNFLDMFKVSSAAENDAKEMCRKHSPQNVDNDEENSDSSSSSGQIYTVNPESPLRGRPKSGLRPVPSLTSMVPSLGEEEEEDDIFLSTEDMMAEVLQMGNSKIICEEETSNKYKVSEKNEEVSLSLVMDQKLGEAEVVFSDIFRVGAPVERTTESNTKENENTSIPEHVLLEIEDQILKANDVPQSLKVHDPVADFSLVSKSLEEVPTSLDLLDEDTLTSVEINQLFDDELRQVGKAPAPVPAHKPSLIPTSFDVFAPGW